MRTARPQPQQTLVLAAEGHARCRMLFYKLRHNCELLICIPRVGSSTGVGIENMKILGWVQRKLSMGSSAYCRVSHQSSNAVHTGAENFGDRDTTLATLESETLLLNHMLGSMLSVGTLGHADLFCSLQYQQQEEEDDEEDDPSTEEVRSTYIQDPGSLLPMRPTDNPYSDTGTYKKMLATEEESTQPLLKETKERVEDRVTLADLFAAADHRNGKSGGNAEQCKMHKKAKIMEQQKKKTTTKKKEKDPQSTAKTTKKLRFITRMLKRKIHPDLMLVRGASSEKLLDGVINRNAAVDTKYAEFVMIEETAPDIMPHRS